MNNEYVLDCTFDNMDGIYCFCPVEKDENGEITDILVGISYLSNSPPEGGRFIGVVHSDGQEACDKWCSENQATIDRLLKERDEEGEGTPEGH